MFHDIQDELYQVARSIREKGDEVQPIAFFVVGEGGVYPMPLTFPKSLWREAIQTALSQMPVEAVILHTEAWAVLGSDTANALHARMHGMGSLEEYPGRKEILMSSLETRDGRYRTLRSIIEDGQLGDTEVEEYEDVATITGNIVNFF